MGTPAAGTQKLDALNHPMYRIAHLHGNRWVTLQPDEQHNPREDEATGRRARDWQVGAAKEGLPAEATGIAAAN